MCWVAGCSGWLARRLSGWVVGGVAGGFAGWRVGVTKFLKVLKQSVRRDHHPSVGDKASPRTPRQLLSNLVFGSDLRQHLSASQRSVPNVVRRVGLSDSDSELLLRILGHLTRKGQSPPG